MKLYLENDNSEMIEIKELEKISNDADVLLFIMNTRLRSKQIDEAEKYLSKKIGKTCVVVDSLVDRVISIGGYKK